MQHQPNRQRTFVLPRVKEVMPRRDRVARMTQAEMVLASLVARPQIRGERAPKRGG